MGVNKTPNIIIFFKMEEFKMQKLNRLNELRLRVIREVENDVAGSSEVVLPAIFKQNVLDLTEMQRISLEIMIDMFLLGELIGESKHK